MSLTFPYFLPLYLWLTSFGQALSSCLAALRIQGFRFEGLSCKGFMGWAPKIRGFDELRF